MTFLPTANHSVFTCWEKCFFADSPKVCSSLSRFSYNWHLNEMLYNQVRFFHIYTEAFFLRGFIFIYIHILTEAFFYVHSIYFKTGDLHMYVCMYVCMYVLKVIKRRCFAINLLSLPM
jgi:hypothetical protein